MASYGKAMDHEKAYADLTHAIIDLHSAMIHGFSAMDSRFDRVEARLTSVDGEVRGLSYWRERIDGRLAALEAR